MVHFYSLRYLITTNEAQTKKRTCVRFLFFSYAKYLLRSPSNALPCLAFSVITRYETVPRTVSPKFIMNLEPRGKGRSINKKADFRPLFLLFLCEISFKKSLKCFTVSCFLRYHSLRNSPPDCFSQIHFEFGASWQGTKHKQKSGLASAFYSFLMRNIS